MAGWTWSNATPALTYLRSFDLDGRIGSFTLGGPAQTYTLTYDNAGRIIQLAAPGATIGYGYDNLDRVTSAIFPSTAYGYSYDGVGNRLSATIGANTYSYAYPATSNRLNSTTGPAPAKSFTYDGAGNATGDGTVTYAYDGSGRPTAATVGGVSLPRQYNGLGQRVGRAPQTGVQVLYAYDEAGRVLTELNVNTGTGAKNGVEYLYLDGVMVAAQAFTIPAGQAPQYVGTFNVHTDHLDTPRLVTNPQNVARWTWLSEPFGMLPANENPAGMGVFPFSPRFPGQVIDKETNTHYNYFRDYDPAIGRYIQSDPIGLVGGINTYGYVGGNPLASMDPRGLQGILSPAFLIPPLLIGGMWAANNPEAARALWNAINSSSSSSDPPSGGAIPPSSSPGDYCQQYPVDPICRDQENRCPGTDKQFGRKFGEYRDPTRSGYRTHQEYRDLADRLYGDPNARRTMFPRNSGPYSGETHIQVGNDLLRLDPSGSFRSLYPIR